MKPLVLRQHRHPEDQGHRGDDSISRVLVVPPQIRRPQPDRGAGGHHSEARVPAQHIRPLPDRGFRLDQTSPLFQTHLPKGDRRNEQTVSALDQSFIDSPPRRRGQLSMAFQPPIQRMGINHHLSVSSSFKASQSSSATGARSSPSEQLVTPFPGPARYSASSSSTVAVLRIRRTSSTSRPWSVTISGSPVRSTSRKYSSIFAFNFPFDTVTTGI